MSETGDTYLVDLLDTLAVHDDQVSVPEFKGQANGTVALFCGVVAGFCLVCAVQVGDQLCFARLILCRATDLVVLVDGEAHLPSLRTRQYPSLGIVVVGCKIMHAPVL